MLKHLIYSALLLSICVFAGCSKSLPECESDEDKITGCVGKEYYYNNGQLEIESETPFKNGKENGIKKKYYKNGRLKRETPHTDGKANGIEKKYYENGRLKGETPYTDGKLNGVVKEYYETGELLREAPYKNGEHDGVAKIYDKNGQLREKHFYLIENGFTKE